MGIWRLGRRARIRVGATTPAGDPPHSRGRHGAWPPAASVASTPQHHEPPRCPRRRRHRHGGPLGARVPETWSTSSSTPRCYPCPGLKGFLISEAVRGEGAVLLDPAGRPLHGKALARVEGPRRVMSSHAAIHVEMEAGRLLPRPAGPCLAYARGATDPGPASPISAHRVPAGRDRYHSKSHFGRPRPRDYSCGGIAVDGWGQSGIDGLFAVGEGSCNWLHGANRLVLTSLLEGIGLGRSCGPSYPGKRSCPPPGVLKISHACGRARLGREWSDQGLRPRPHPGRHANHSEHHVALRRAGALRRSACASFASCATCRTRSRPSTGPPSERRADRAAQRCLLHGQPAAPGCGPPRAG